MDGKMKKIIFIIITLSFSATATEIIYTPINPSFGGNPLNANMLLSKAQAQNKHKAPVIEKGYADQFKDSLERTYLNRMVREITDMAFGEDPENSIFNQDSIFMSGDYQIEIITSTTDTITVKITNIIDDTVVIIEVPRFG
ncbi:MULTISPECIES: curli assembly protein CsgF [Pseudoalteromonas]|jgi:curli production assembly/transport component CsgF|uniref:Curli production assembly/transport component CsgF n=2 Tax=Pseudoalteromonas aliena TaxID=247523 RepID=A0A1Q2H1X3_9GAMM|nr:MULTISPECIES: curli assembly protein CsgF [Pseudoalteromonas]AQQ01362.1 curli production assembly protein CsgF [Pseudoalteromonas aliena]MBB1384099.1 curli production assembly protein CsgF [Pseudoalteromonas sp. SG45-5]MBB1392211.1 curli production assembly protein CsgF [Pseudoalteromonas sp. SG44-4]MBB1449235.1 curli production assembly protein CsgF [Pseudoalteromonas sp. SG41-6]MBE0359251.1 curli production assembly/transport component CsgF [Pseudoalteromonas aliena SW19]